jgi:hypothetical protein
MRGQLHPCLKPSEAAEETLIFLEGLLDIGMLRVGMRDAATLEAAIGMHIRLRRVL